jgi:hypothetical protein
MNEFFDLSFTLFKTKMRNPILFLVLAMFSTSLHAQSIISSSTSFSQADVSGYTWPISITGGSMGDPVIVTLSEDITLNQSNQYFTIDGDWVTFEGNNMTVTIDNVLSYPGLLRNGTSVVDAYHFATVNNTIVHSFGSTMLNQAGWIGQSYFGFNDSYSSASFNNCSSDGAIRINGGGITGIDSWASIYNCHSTGNITSSAGGIFGAFSQGYAEKCYSKGNISVNAGGIAGRNSYVSVVSCYSIGTINSFAGGIVGPNSGSSVSDSYSTGNIGSSAGGIYGQNSFGNISNCYSLGTINIDGGGIAGYGFGGYATNCYSIGVINGGGGIFGTNYYGSYDNCLSEGSGTWYDYDAEMILTGLYNGYFTDISWSNINLPYKLTVFNQTNYSPATENLPANALINSPAGNFSPGTYSIVTINSDDPAVNPAVSIDAATGMISFTDAGLGSFTVTVYFASSTNGSYQISDYTLNILNILPVTWHSFTVTQKGSAAWLQWSIDGEQNTREFIVQHSINGSSWTTIGSVNTTGNGGVVSNYSYLHDNPVTGNNYYRLQLNDPDGKPSYSTVQKLKMAAGNKSFTVINTIVSNGVLQVLVNTPTLLYLFSNDGKLVWQKQCSAGLQTIDLGNTSKGIYFLRGNNAVEKILVH